MEICNGDDCCLQRLTNSIFFEKKKVSDVLIIVNQINSLIIQNAKIYAPQYELDARDGICCFFRKTT